MTNTQLTEKLEKIVQLAIRGATEGERASAVDKLHRLCKKFACRLTDYVGGLSGELANIDYRKVEKPKDEKPQSRRSLIIRFVQENIWTTADLAEFLTFFSYSDIKANKKAVAGTLYDMQKNKGWDVRRCNDGRICVV